jgi:predicted amidophosphoribosyltransferase
LKATSVDAKLDQLKGTIEIDGNAFKGKSVLIIDDLYQSGTSVNYLGMLLLEAGAKRILGLACEKTVGNFDNVSSRGG